MRTVYRMSAARIAAGRIRGRIWRWMTKDAPAVYLRGSDLITAQSMVDGVHEPHLSALIRQLAHDGFGGFLLDVGANIGLISFQCARDFAEVHCFEPNPDVFKILSVNVKASGRSDFVLHEFGIGDADATIDLNVPIANFGGAFIGGAGNRYEESILAGKDGFDRLDDANYRKVAIRIRDGRRVFREIFSGFAERGLTSGVVKIDVEGYEETVLTALAATIPRDFRVVVVFENLDPAFDAARLSSIFAGRGHAYKIESDLGNGGWLSRAARSALRGRTWFLVDRFADSVGDLVWSTHPLE